MVKWEAEAAVRGLPPDSHAFWTEVEPWMVRAVSMTGRGADDPARGAQSWQSPSRARRHAERGRER